MESKERQSITEECEFLVRDLTIKFGIMLTAGVLFLLLLFATLMLW